LSLYKIEQIMNGALDEMIDLLIMADQMAKLQAAREDA
jgi:protein subunit release factor A